MKNENGITDEREQERQLIRLEIILEQLVTKVDVMSKTIDHLKDNYVVSATADMAVANSKVERLESIVFGTIGALGVELLAIFFLIFGK